MHAEVFADILNCWDICCTYFISHDKFIEQ